MKISVTPQTEADVVIAAREAENRKITAENEYATICINKKRVQEEKEILEKEIERLKTNIEEKIKDNLTTEEVYNDIKRLCAEEQIILDEITEERNKADEELSKYLFEVDKKKTEAQKELESIKNEQAVIRESFVIETEDLISKTNSLKEDMEKMKLEISSVNETFFTEVSKLEEVRAKQLEITKEVDVIKNNVISLQETFANVEKQIKEKEMALKEYDITIFDLNEKKSVLEREIVNKTEELKKMESMAFAISKREDALLRKEEFIKYQYERAGVKWE